MIAAKPSAPAGVAARLAERARHVAEAQAEDRLRARSTDPARWRDARLLWPLISKGP